MKEHSLTSSTKAIAFVAIVMFTFALLRTTGSAPPPAAQSPHDLYERYGTGIATGVDEAPVVLLVYSDYQCGFCRRFLGTLDSLRILYPQHVNVIWKNIAVDENSGSIRTIMGAHCAAEIGEFEAFHRAAFENAAVAHYVDGWRLIADSARIVGRDSIERCIGSLRYRARVEGDIAEARAVGSGQTPSWFLNGRRGIGAIGLETLDSLTARELRRRPRPG